MTHAMEQKAEMINEYIARIEDAISKNDQNEAGDLVREIVGVYEAEIEGLGRHLSFYSGGYEIDNAKKVRARLKNYVLNLQAGLYKPFQDKGAITVTQTAEQKVETVVQVSLEQTVKLINELPEETLSADDKEKLNGKLAGLSAQNGMDKATRWETAKSVLKWIADKSVEVGLAALPYIMEAMK